MFHKAIFAATLLAASALGGGAHAQSITIAPGVSPGSGYLPLSLFGIAPIADLTGNGFVSLNTPSFVFGGSNWSGLTVYENGFITLGVAPVPALATSANLSLPSVGNARSIIAPYWTNIDSTGGAIRAGTLTNGVATWIVIDWDSVLLPNSATRSSFELWLGVGVDDTSFSYGTMGTTSSFTVGAQDASGTIGTNYRLNSGLIASNTELRVTSSGLPVGAVPEPATWGMMIAGLALTGGLMRRRQLTVSFA